MTDRKKLEKLEEVANFILTVDVKFKIKTVKNHFQHHDLLNVQNTDRCDTNSINVVPSEGFAL